MKATKNGRDYLGKPPCKTTVCIVGTGPAGVTAAWYLVNAGVDVTLIEGSRVFDGRDPNAPIDSQIAYELNENTLLYDGVAADVMAQNEPEFLVRPSPKYNSGPWERERQYGGTSTHWGGQSRPLDAITFRKRPGFPGWPVTRKEMDRYYCEATSFCGLVGPYYHPDTGEAGYNFSSEFWRTKIPGTAVPPLDNFFVAMYQFFNDRQFQAKKVGGITIGESKARVILNASLKQMETTGSKVTTLTCGVLNDSESQPAYLGDFTIEADYVILACGAVANARQLLLSGLGNPNYVGHYFMAHPIASGANAVSTNPDYLTAEEQNLVRYQQYFESGSNIYQVAGLFTPGEEAATRLESARCWFGTGGTGNFYHGTLPEYTSAITLTDEIGLDIFEQERTKISWNLSPDEPTNYANLAGLFRDAVQALARDRKKTPDPWPVHIDPWNRVEPFMVINGHHLGTTRMAATEDDGVVDSDLKVFGLDNLFVAGSSVWASSGISNPTFSIITFSIRLADRLNQLINPGSESLVPASCDPPNG